jgi:hypothetical protein
MAKKQGLTARLSDETTSEDVEFKIERAIREHGLVGDVVFDPPLTPEERRQRGVGIPIEERIEQVRRQFADGIDWS